MISVMNCKKTKLCHEYDFRIDRGSPVGNPYPLQFEKARDLVCDKYTMWFYEQLKGDASRASRYVNKMMGVYKEYGKLRLFCWCAPLRCHGETIKEYILKEKEMNCPNCNSGDISVKRVMDFNFYVCKCCYHQWRCD